MVICDAHSRHTHIDYQYIVKNALSNFPPFELRYEGITLSRNAILIRGFDEKNHLNELRENIRNAFKNSHLFHSIDKRYKIQTAHLTVIRFRELLKAPSRFMSLLEDYYKGNFGSCRVENLELVYNDWYHKNKNSKVLSEFNS